MAKSKGTKPKAKEHTSAAARSAKPAKPKSKSKKSKARHAAASAEPKSKKSKAKAKDPAAAAVSEEYARLMGTLKTVERVIGLIDGGRVALAGLTDTTEATDTPQERHAKTAGIVERVQGGVAQIKEARDLLQLLQKGGAHGQTGRRSWPCQEHGKKHEYTRLDRVPNVS